LSDHFVTGTGTCIGKTWLCCALLRYWRAVGCAPQAFKPVLSGFDPATPETSDAGQLLAALGRKLDVAALDEIAPWRFSAPLSPDMAAMREGRRIDFDALSKFTRRIVSASTLHPSANFPTLVEGVGGVMAPLDAQHTVRDWIASSGLPCILVAGSYLGSLSHTLTALESLKKVGVDVTAITLNETPASPVSLAETLAALRRHAGAVPVLGISRAAPQTGVVELAALIG